MHIIACGALCREFLEQGEERDKLGEGQQAHSAKGQPLPSAASIRPLLLKASALLANVKLACFLDAIAVLLLFPHIFCFVR